MAKTASQYPVTTEYGCIKGYPLHLDLCAEPGYGFHKGRDRIMPTGTKVIVGDTPIGLSGNTGASTGAHLHIGAYPETTGVPINCKPYEFKAGTVHSTGYTPTNGNYVRVKVGKMLVIYLHLSKILVKPGHIIKPKPEGNTDMITKNGVAVIYRWRLGRVPTSTELNKYVGKKTFDQTDTIIRGGNEFKAQVPKVKASEALAREHLPVDMRS